MVAPCCRLSPLDLDSWGTVNYAVGCSMVSQVLAVTTNLTQSTCFTSYMGKMWTFFFLSVGLFVCRSVGLSV